MKSFLALMVAVSLCLAEGAISPINVGVNGEHEHSFYIDRGSCNCFRMDGKPFRYISGTMHYFRVPRQYWPDRLAKMKACGLNAVETYVAWNEHEPFKNEFHFEGDLDLEAFLTLVQEMGMFVVLRPSPFIDAERDMGGLPFWLLHDNLKMFLRSVDVDYLRHVRDWYSHLLPRLRRHLFINGGPIITVQIENEYGSYGCSEPYLRYLEGLVMEYLDADVQLFTTDGSSLTLVACGRINSLAVQATIDFGSGANVTRLFDKVLRRAEPTGPAINSEYYPGQCCARDVGAGN